MENGQVKNLTYVEQVFSLLVVYRFIAKRAHERSWIRQSAEASRFMPDFVSHSGLFHIRIVAGRSSTQKVLGHWNRNSSMSLRLTVVNKIRA